MKVPKGYNECRFNIEVMEKPNEDHKRVLLCVIKYVSDKKDKAICMNTTMELANKEWILASYSDFTYTSDPDKKTSVTGYIILLQGMNLAWKSHGQKSVTLSSIEAEYVAGSETCQEMIRIMQILKFMDMKIKFPMEIKIDNVGAIYLTNNQTTGGRTRHVNIRYHFVHQYVEDGMIKINFVHSEDNKVDAWTKNLSTELYHKHVDDYVTTFPHK
jgi:hypothetical protein